VEGCGLRRHSELCGAGLHPGSERRAGAQTSARLAVQPAAGHHIQLTCCSGSRHGDLCRNKPFNSP
jgi:hypothetical protein